jgi:hypothetical protein
LFWSMRIIPLAFSRYGYDSPDSPGFPLAALKSQLDGMGFVV